ncbi:MAG: polyamine aminopropyltransferase [Mariprofundales bacterium]
MALFLILFVLAACGLIYEYLLSHYAGRVLGAMEAVIYGIIGLMIVSMGLGAFLARYVRQTHTAFAWLEACIALLGSSAVLLLGAAFAFAALLPRILSATFDLPPDLLPTGGMLQWPKMLAKFAPWFMAFLLGLCIGMEIPLLARVRQDLYAHHLEHNTGAVYGIDYIGAGFGALLWVVLMLQLDASQAAAFTAYANIAIGLLFLALFRQHIKAWAALLVIYLLLLISVSAIALYGEDWDAAMENMLYQDYVIYSTQTPYQHLVLTARIMDASRQPVYTFYINGRTQFSSVDEHMYHSMLVYPAMAAAGHHQRVLVIGGGDGLAVREILRWNPQEVLLLDLDTKLVHLFSEPEINANGVIINQALLRLNNAAFADKRVQTRFGDAFLLVDELLKLDTLKPSQALFDVIIIDLPDPSHPDLNKLYSQRFYAKLRVLLAGDGIMAVQSTSPYHAKHTFLCIGKTIKAAGFNHVQQYHHNVPSFGEWGFSIASKQGVAASTRLKRLPILAVDDNYITPELMQAAFVFSKNFAAKLDDIEINRLGNLAAYRYHQQDWATEQGIVDIE